MKLRRAEQLNTNIYKHTQKPKKKNRELTMKLRSLKEFGHRSGLKERERGHWLDKQIPLTVQSWVRLYKTISLIRTNTNCSSLSNSNSNKTHFYWNLSLSLSLSLTSTSDKLWHLKPPLASSTLKLYYPKQTISKKKKKSFRHWLDKQIPQNITHTFHLFMGLLSPAHPTLKFI